MYYVLRKKMVELKEVCPNVSLICSLLAILTPLDK